MEPLAQTDHAELYQKLRDFHIDGAEDVAFSFTDRLASENGWSHQFAERVTDEYRKFLLLAVAAGHPVTPSDQVDQAWHLHLTYSRSYWQRLCPDVLGKDLHHGPTQGGAEEAAKYDDWYRNTLESYERFFGYSPPKEIWPEPSVRFGEDLHFRRVNTSRYWVLPKVKPLRSSGTHGLLLLGTMGILVACYTSLGATPGGSILADISWLWIPFIVLFVVLAWLFGDRCPKCGKSGLDNTGETRSNKVIGQTSEQTEILWKCKHCDHEVWKPKSSSSANGCGGCGGCGG